MAEVPVGWWASDESLLLGHAIRFGDQGRRRPLRLTIAQRTRSLECIGGSGGGKSRFARLLLSQDLACNRGHALIDAQDLAREHIWSIAESALPGPLTDQLIAQLGDKLIVVAPADQTRGVVGYNFLEPRPGVTTAEQVDSLVQLLSELFPDFMGPRLIDVTRNSLLVLAEHDLTIAEMVLFLSDDAVRTRLVQRSRNAEVKTFFLQHLGGLRPSEVRIWLESSRNKWSVLGGNNFLRLVVGQRRSTFNFDDAINSGKIILINLSRHHIKAEPRAVLGAMFINALHQAAIAREDTPLDQRYFYPIFVDEAQTYWTTTIAEILEAGRKYGLSLNLFHQSTRQRPFDVNRGAIDTTLANAHCRVCFGVARQDAERMASEFFNPSGRALKFQHTFLGLPQERPSFWGMGEEHQNMVRELMQQQPQECYISLRGLDDNSLPWQVQVPFVPDVHPHPEKVAALLEHVAGRYYRPIEVIEREIRERWQSLREQAGTTADPPPDFFT